MHRKSYFPKSYYPESLQQMKERLRQLETVEMLGPDDLILLELKQALRAKIAEAEATGIADQEQRYSA